MKNRKVIATVLVTSMVLGIVGCQKKKETSISDLDSSIETVYESSDASAETVEETVEETVDETVVETTEETTVETTEETTKETEGTEPTDPTTPPTEGTTPPPTSGTTPPPTESTRPTYPAIETPTYWRYGGKNVEQMNVEGYGTVYYVSWGTSGQLDQVNQLRADAGVPALSGGNQSTATTRAVEAAIKYSMGGDPHTRPNGQNCFSLGLRGENATTNTNDPVSAYNASEGHRSNLVHPDYTQMSTVSVSIVKWYPCEGDTPDGGCWTLVSSANVQCYW